MILDMIYVMGLNKEPKKVLVNGHSAQFLFYKNTTTLHAHVNADLLPPLNITWT